jgi:hypothetical protein
MAIRGCDSDAWDDCSVELEPESESWFACDVAFPESLSFEKGDCLLYIAHEEEDDRWCWGELKGTGKQGWVPRGLFTMRGRNAHQAAENRLAALATFPQTQPGTASLLRHSPDGGIATQNPGEGESPVLTKMNKEK